MNQTEYKLQIESLVHALGIARATLVIYPDGSLRLHQCDAPACMVRKNIIAKFLSDKVDEYYDA